MSYLARLPLFSDLSAQQLRELEQHTLLRSYPKNTIVITEGDNSDSLYIIVSGRMRVYCSDDEGREITLNDLSSGDYFGELALLDNQQRSASVITTEACRLLQLNKASLLEAFRQTPDIAYHLLVNLTQRVRALTSNVKNLALMDVYGRVAKTLLELSEKEGETLATTIPLTQQDIANRVGASREMVSRIMKDLVTGGYITVEKKKIVINDHLPAHY
ncbi:MAG: Crp/Fnr family transcriptional regulator [Gammaproteobacteria bacterium]|uniref:Crp/Fnr family transcriptional regulator n=1 Tax=Pseudomaricurvus alcaniphilus TaxID=1166482 RepID=UPI00140DF497|nr:Crp/Fnr family transcriptional regulator [Pseudomaricurvus alcaniphilus]MBR9909717.1 Crp/Fnr family transcriptional regulator [Gammaproteobacteria bacterium]NHN38436.1 Crp/Fnr family transcriptional regulator [Pseudomaricurvus alcaniphilus]